MEFLLSHGSLWEYLEGLMPAETKYIVLTPEVKSRLQAEIDLLFTQCVVDVSDLNLSTSSNSYPSLTPTPLCKKLLRRVKGA